MLNMRWRTDLSALDRLERTLPTQLDNAVNQAADYMVDYIKSNWSSEAPSSPFNAPAVVSGRLDASIRKNAPRGLGGRFSHYNNAVSMSVIADTPYAAALEFGYSPRNLLPRPYFFTAAEATALVFGDYVKGAFQWR